MPLTQRQTGIGKFLRRYFYGRTAQIRDQVVPTDKDGSITRECLRSLLAAGFVRRHEPRLLERGRTTAPPIFILTQKGSCELAATTGDCRDILTIEPTFRDWMGLNHACALTSLHMTIDASIERQDYVTQHSLFFEHEVICPDAEEPSKKFRLHTTTSKSPLVFCCPDSAFETEVAGYRRAIYVERETGSDTPRRVAAKKHKGYAGLHASQLFKHHFPEARDFRVLAVCPYADWMQSLRREMRGKPGSELWLFCDIGTLTAETFLHEPIFFTVEKGPLPFVPRPKPAAVSLCGGGAGASAGGGLYV